MSYLNNIYVKPPINLVDGVVKDETVINLGYQIETAFENIGDIFGNLYGDGLETAKYARYINSVSSAIGDISKLSPEEPFKTLYESYLQVFAVSGTRKDFILDLHPIEGEEETTITIVANNSINYEWVSEENFTNETHFTTKGRILIFYKVPEISFEVIYKGTYPEFGTQSGFMPNVYQSPDILVGNPDLKPNIELMPSGRYKITITKTNYNSNGMQFGSELDLKFNPIIEQYISPVGNLEVPREYVNAWIKRPHSYERLPTRAIYILNDTQFEIDTDEVIELGTDTIVFAIANVSLSGMLNDLYKLVRNHNHDSSSIVPTIDHDKLTNLIPISENEDIIYSKSNMINNDHPEYIHREGYRLDDDGTYNNAILGDLLIAASAISDTTGSFENIEKDSNRLSFGSIADGISFRLRPLDDTVTPNDPSVLELKSPNDGLYIDTGTDIDEGKNSRALRLNNHELFTYGIDNGSSIDQYLSLSSDSGVTYILDKNSPSNFADLKLNKLFAHNIDVTGLLNILLPDGKLQIGDVLITPLPGGGLIIDGDIHFTGIIELDLIDATDGEIDRLVITEYLEIKDDGTRIKFSDNGKTSEIATTYDSQIEIRSEDPVRYKTPIILDGVSGRDPAVGATIERINGISIIDDGDPALQEYMSIYVSSPAGSKATPSTGSTYMEMYYPEASDLEENTNGLWLIRNTRVPQIEKGVKYAWKSNDGDKRVDSLTDWPRAKLTAGFGDFYSIKVNASNLIDKDGVKFGDFNYIFVTGDGGNCPAGLMVMESLAGVAMVQAGMDPADCANVVYSSLIVGDIQSRGSISAEDDISAGGGVNAGTELSGDTLEIRKDSQIFGDERVFGNETIDGDFFVLGESSFNSNVDINGQLKVTNKAEVGNLEVIGVSGFGEIARFHSAVSMEESVNVAGLAQFDGYADFRSRLTAKECFLGETHTSSLEASDLISANGGIEVASTAVVRGNIIGESALDIKGSAIIAAAVYSHGLNSTADLNVAERTTLDGDLTTNADILFSGDGSFVSNVKSQFTQDAIFGQKISSGNISVTGNIDVSGTIETNMIDATSINVLGAAKTGSLETDFAIIRNDVTIGGSMTIGQQAANPVLVSLNGSISSSGSIYSKGSIGSGSTITTDQGFNAGSGSGSFMHELNLTGGLSVTKHISGMGGASFFEDVRATTNMQVDGTIGVGQTVKIEIGDGRISVGDVTGDKTDDPGQLSVSYGTFRSLTGVTQGNELPMPEGNVGDEFKGVRDQALQVRNFLRLESMHCNNMAVFAGQVIMNNDIWTNSIRPINVEDSTQDWVDIIARKAYYAPD